MLLISNREGPIGRYHLKDIMGLSEHEGLVRQMLVDLRKQGYSSTSKSGCVLTQNGKTLLMKRLKVLHIADIKPFDSPIFQAGPVSIGLHLQNRADKIDSAMKIREVKFYGARRNNIQIRFVITIQLEGEKPHTIS